MTLSTLAPIVDSARSILVVGAHAFDAEVIAGPLAASAALRGTEVTLLHLSLGEQGHRTLPPEMYAQQKRSEAEAAAATLGVSWRTLSLPDGFIPADDQTALAVCDVIREVRPDAVVTHWRGSWHRDHQAAHAVTMHGVLLAALPTLPRGGPAHSPRLVLFGENWEDDDGYRPTDLLDVTTGMQRWRDAVRCYELARGLANFPYVDYYSSLYRMRGCLAGCGFAQGFAVASPAALGGVGQFLPNSFGG